MKLATVKTIKILITHTTLLTGLSVAFAINSTATMAGTLYRCGNTFQDTPCQGTNNAASNKPLKTIKTGTTTAATTTNPAVIPVDSNCKARGEAAKKISWDREVGVTADAQIEANKYGYAPSLIREVYTHRGSSLEVRNKIEQSCMEQKARNELAARLEASAERLRDGDNLQSTEAANNAAAK